MSFSISIDLVIPDHITQFAKPVSFSPLAWFPKFDESFAIVFCLSGVSSKFLRFLLGVKA